MLWHFCQQKSDTSWARCTELLIYPNIVLLIHHSKDGWVALVHTNLNMFCVGIFLKVEDCKRVVSYMQVHRHAPTRGAACLPPSWSLKIKRLYRHDDIQHLRDVPFGQNQLMAVTLESSKVKWRSFEVLD